MPPRPSVPQLAGWGWPSDSAARDAKEAKRNERSTVTTDEYEAPHLPQPTPVMTTALSRKLACQRTDRSRTHQLARSTTAECLT
ncbi:hypothetical protein BJD13_15265 [Xanthomonas perforans]|nr:hypothetical protein BJD13_15265 [Xanthomonas perforans]AQS76735.1 hypothetical protein XPE_10930 [Xanthomonas perforans 91-118]